MATILPATSELEKALIQSINRLNSAVPHGFQRATLRLVRDGVATLSSSIEGADAEQCSWQEAPWWDFHPTMDYDFKNRKLRPYEFSKNIVEKGGPTLDVFCEEIAFRVLSKFVVGEVNAGGPQNYAFHYVPKPDNLSPVERRTLMHDHICFGAPPVGSLDQYDVLPVFRLGDFAESPWRNCGIGGDDDTRHGLRNFRMLIQTQLAPLFDGLDKALSFRDPFDGFVRVQFMPSLVYFGDKIARYRVTCGVNLIKGVTVTDRAFPPRVRLAFWKRMLEKIDLLALQFDDAPQHDVAIKHEIRLDRGQGGRPRNPEYTSELRDAIVKMKDEEGLSFSAIVEELNRTRSLDLNRNMVKSLYRARKRELQEKARR